MVKLYTEDVKPFAEEYAGKINYARIKTNLEALLKTVRGSTDHEDYVTRLKGIINEEFITATPSKLKDICSGFIPADMSKRFNKKQFYKLVVDAMEYDKARSLYRSYVPQMGIKTCVYCNAQYAVTFTRKNRVEYAQFEIDHWMSKNMYPCLSVSFYNFVPSCSSCNKHKGTDLLLYSMYSEIPKLIAPDGNNPFVFSIPDSNLCMYLNHFNSDLLKIEFKSRASDTQAEKDYARFAINEMYNLFKDEAGLTIKRYLFFSDAYRKQMKMNYGAAFTNSIGYDEFIYGVPLNSKDAYKRPLGKMVQDIRAQLEISTIYFSWIKKKGYL